MKRLWFAMLIAGAVAIAAIAVAIAGPRKIVQTEAHVDRSAPTFVPSPAPPQHVAAKAEASKTVRGITLELRHAQWAGQRLRLDICYTFPDEKHQWLLTNQPKDAYVRIGNQKFPVQDFGLLAWEKDAQGRTVRCDAAYFGVSPDEATAAEATLHIGALAQDMPEQPDCATVQKALAKEDIQVECQSASLGSGVQVIQSPPGMSKEEVARRVAEAIAPHFTGPWEIAFSLP